MELPLYKKLKEFEDNYMLDYYNLQNEINYFEYLRLLISRYEEKYSGERYLTINLDVATPVTFKDGEDAGSIKTKNIIHRIYKNEPIYEMIIQYSQIINFLKVELEKEIIKLKTPKSLTPEVLEPAEVPENDFSDNKLKERIIILEKLGIIDYIKSMQEKPETLTHTAEILSAFTGLSSGTLYSYILPILQANRNDSDKNSPYKDPENLRRANKTLNKLKIKNNANQ